MQKGMTYDEAQELIRKSVRLAKNSRDSFVKSDAFKGTGRMPPLVAASLGPYGAYLADGSEYRGNYQVDTDALKSFHKERIEIIDKESPDLYALETVPVLDEALAVADLLNELKIKTPLWISFSCKDGEHISDGTKIRECALRLEEFSNVVAIGVNCTPPRFVESLIQNIREVSSKNIIVYPNSGEIYNPFTKTWSGSSSKFLSLVKAWYEAGATMIGGCCRTTPLDIRKIAQMARA